ncbi:MAG: PIN domain-containing protein [Candidatus Asgardarchaeia archaeon]
MKVSTRILLDTTFLLPTLGISVKNSDEVYKKLKNYVVYISRYSILEALWVLNSFKKRGYYSEKTVREGLDSLLLNNRFMKIDETPEALILSMKLYDLGHRDLIDNLLYSIAYTSDLLFLTVDDKFMKFIEKIKMKDIFITPEML